jgi:hypothetical protein
MLSRVMRRMRWIVVLALALAGALAASAGARTFCVSDPHCVSVGGVDRGSDLQAALTAATSTSGADTVKIGAGRFSAADGFVAADNRDAITVIGAGRDLTTLTATRADSRVLDFGTSTNATVSDLSIAMPASGGVGVFVPQHIARVTISGGRGGATGLWTQNTTVDDVSIQLPLDGSSTNTGLYRPNGTLRADGLAVTAHKGIDGFGSNDTYRHVRVLSDGTGIGLGGSGSFTTTLDDVQIRMTGASVGLRWQAIFGTPANMTARFLTIRGDGTAASVGVDSHGSTAGSVATTTLEDSIVAGFDHALSCSVASSGAARLVARYSTFDASDLVNGCAAPIDTRTGNLAADLPLTSAPNGDLLLPAGSPAIDAGDPALTAPAPTIDLAGNARLVDGNRDGTARVDMGAFEYAPPPPIIPPPPGGGGSGGGSSRTGDGKPTQPVVRSFSIAPRRFAPVLGRPLARARARRGPHRGATFTYVLSTPAAVKIVIEQAVRGHRSGRGGACRPGRGRGRPCTRWTRRTTLRQVASDAVRRSVAFSGRVGRRPLPAGSYRATLIAHLGGVADSLPSSVRFTLLS